MHENGMSPLVRKTLSWVGILVVGFYGGRLASDVTFTSNVQEDRARIAFSTSGESHLGVDYKKGHNFIVFDANVFNPLAGYAGFGVGWVDGPKSFFRVEGPQNPSRFLDVSS